MRTIITETKAYKFNELSEKAKQKAIEKLCTINVDYEWWESVYEDAKMIGLKITEFDIDYKGYCRGKLTESAVEVADLIIKNHGSSCGTYKLAESFITDRDQIVENQEKDEHGEIIDVYDLDLKLDEIENHFEIELLREYADILKKEYDYLTSEKAIIETIEAKDYEFNKEGDLV